MSDERRYYERIRRRANRARERLTDTLEQARIAAARDKRTDERRAARDWSGPQRGSERDSTRFGKHARKFGEDRPVGVQPDALDSPDAER